MPKQLRAPKKLTFSAVIEAHEKYKDAAYISMPFSVKQIFGTNGQVKVKATFDGHPYRGTLANMGIGCHGILVRKDIRATIGKQAGNRVKVVIEKDLEEKIITVPEDLKRMFSKNKKAKELFNTLSYTNRKEYVVWITSAKKIETRERRLADTFSKLLKGLKNPSQK